MFLIVCAYKLNTLTHWTAYKADNYQAILGWGTKSLTKHNVIKTKSPSWEDIIHKVRIMKSINNLQCSLLLDNSYLARTRTNKKVHTCSAKWSLLRNLVNECDANRKEFSVNWKANAKKNRSADNDMSAIPKYIICQARHIKRYALSYNSTGNVIRTLWLWKQQLFRIWASISFCLTSEI